MCYRARIIWNKDYNYLYGIWSQSCCWSVHGGALEWLFAEVWNIRGRAPAGNQVNLRPDYQLRPRSEIGIPDRQECYIKKRRQQLVEAAFTGWRSSRSLAGEAFPCRRPAGSSTWPPRGCRAGAGSARSPRTRTPPRQLVSAPRKLPAIVLLPRLGAVAGRLRAKRAHRVHPDREPRSYKNWNEL